MHGEPLTIEGTEFLARALQHETDHLNGILFVDRMGSENRKAAMREIRESEWFTNAAKLGESPSIKISPHLTRGLGH
jgi:peptide deformylase